MVAEINLKDWNFVNKFAFVVPAETVVLTIFLAGLGPCGHSR
jgi:hypothetical protein